MQTETARQPFALATAQGRTFCQKTEKSVYVSRSAIFLKRSSVLFPTDLTWIKMKLDEGVGYTHKTQQFSNNVFAPFFVEHARQIHFTFTYPPDLHLLC